jgi:DegV family protein with EDD domain
MPTEFSVICKKSSKPNYSGTYLIPGGFYVQNSRRFKKKITPVRSIGADFSRIWSDRISKSKTKPKEVKMLRIVTDGAADFPAGWEKEFDIEVIPINIQFGEKTYLQNVDLDTEGFYRLVDQTKRIPKTSQPSPHQFTEFYKKIAQRGETILSVHVTAKLSGTYASAVAAAEELKGVFNVIPLDSAGGSLGLGMMCREARRLDRAGKTPEQIVKYLEGVRSRIRIILTLDTLEYARMSGRVGALSAALASLLNVKPIAVLQNGIVDMVEKVRTRKAALRRVIEMAHKEFGNKRIYLGVVHARDIDSGNTMMTQARNHLNGEEAYITDLAISLAANFGPGTVGLVLYPIE